MMTRSRALWWSAGTVVAAALISFAVAKLAVERPHSHGSEQSFHEWLHANLKITAVQESKLSPLEAVFEAERRRVRAEIESAGRELALAIRAHEAGSVEVDAARKRLARAQEELQQATLDHFFAMKEHLDAEQGEKLLEWTHDSIIHGHGD